MTKLEKEVDKVVKYLKPINERQKKWCLENSFRYCALGYDDRKKRCAQCGKLMSYNAKECPHCGEKIKYNCRGRGTQRAFVIITTTCKCWQVFRTIQVSAIFHHKKINMWADEVCQNWFDSEGNRVIRALPLQMMSSNYALGGEMRYKKVRQYSSYYISKYFYDQWSDIYPYKKTIPIFRRNGFKGNFHGISPVDVYTYLLKDNLIETLFKCGQYSICKHIIDGRYPQIPEHCIKLALRHHKIIRDAKMWADYIKDLDDLKMDTHNPKLVLCDNLIKEHRETTLRLERQRERDRKKQQYLDSLKDSEKRLKEFLKMKGAYIGVAFNDGKIFIKALKSPKEYTEEGHAMHHCVGGYWSHPDSLILSARTSKGRRIETVEVSLSTFEVVQSRGHNNEYTSEHNRIISLVNKNMNIIRKISRTACKAS